MGDIAESAEVVIVGGGPAGYTAALRLAAWGQEVVLVAAGGRYGGTCLHEGCIPSKSLIHATHLAYLAAHAEKMGVFATGVSFDMGRWREFKGEVVGRLQSGLTGQLQKAGVSLVSGRASFADARNIVVTTEQGLVRYHFQHAIIATGSRAKSMPDFICDGQFILDSQHLLDLKVVPERLAVIGAGYIGLELGIALAQTGTQVTIYEMATQILAGWPSSLIGVLTKRMVALGIELKLKTAVQAVEQQSSTVVVTGTCEERSSSQEFDKVLVAVGREPVFEQLGLEKLGVATTPQGFVAVNHAQTTNVSHIWAAGDVTGGELLAHKACHEALVAAEGIAGHPAQFDAFVPKVIFSAPEMASVGLTEAEARSLGYPTKKIEIPFSRLGRAVATDLEEGRAQLVYEEEDRTVLGVHIIGPAASELIAEATLALEMGAHLTDIADMIHAHPTFSEIYAELLRSS